jgi:hypothetical protein
MSASSLKVVYCAFFHSVMSYGIIFWGNTSHRSIIFRIQRQAIRIEYRVEVEEITNFAFDITIHVIFINVCT